MELCIILLCQRQNLGLGYDISLKFTTTIGSPIIVTHHLDDHGSNAFGVMLKTEYISDTRNRTRFAESGLLNRLSANLFKKLRVHHTLPLNMILNIMFHTLLIYLVLIGILFQTNNLELVLAWMELLQCLSMQNTLLVVIGQ